MSIQVTPYSIILLITACLDFGFVVYTDRNYQTQTARMLSFAILLSTEWALTVGLENLFVDLNTKIFLAKLSYLGVYGCVPFFLLFTIHFAGKEEWITPGRIIGLFVIPVIILCLVFTNESHHLIWSGFIRDPDLSQNLVYYLRGPLYWLGVVYNYTLITFILMILLVQNYNSKGLFRTQIRTLILGIIPVIFANLVYLGNAEPLAGRDLTPIGFTWMGFFFFLGMRRYYLLRVQPFPREAILDGIQYGVLVLSEENIIIDHNPALVQLLEIQSSQLVGMKAERVLTDYPDLVTHLQSETNFQIEMTLPGENPEIVAVNCRSIGSPLSTNHARLLTFQDITWQKQIEQKEKEQRLVAEALRDVTVTLTSTLEFDEVLDRIIENVQKVLPYGMTNVILIDEHGIGRVVRYLGYEDDELLGWVKKIEFDVLHTPNMCWMIENSKPMIIADTHQVDFWVRKDAGVHAYLGAPIQIKGHTFGFINQDHREPDFYTPEMAERLQTFADLAAIALDNARLFQLTQEMAIVDELTGMNNRRYFFQMAANEIKRCNRYGKVCCLIICDIDHFKQINDTYGHPKGDEALRQASRLISEYIRDIDISCRYGGDEFCILLPETDLASALKIAERLADAFRKQPRSESSFTVSFGIAPLDEDILTVEELLSRADQALYWAKQNGRNRIEVWEPD